MQIVSAGTMDTVDWASSSSVGANDVMLSDNLLDFVKDEDIVNSLSTNDDIFPQGEPINFTLFRCFLILFKMISTFLFCLRRRHFQ